MKKFSSLFCLLAVICVTCVFTSCNKSSDEEEDLSPRLSRYVDMKITRCERVGARIVVEFDLKNRSGSAISDLSLYPASLKDNLGKEYSTYDNIGMRVKGSLQRPFELGPINIQKDETIKMEVIAAGFDASNTAKSVNLVINGNIKDVELDDKTVKASASVVDNRVLDNGIQTNDAGVVWSIKSCKRANGDLYVTYNMKNNTGAPLRNIDFNEASYMTKGYTFVAMDNLAQTYGNLNHAIEGSNNYSYWLSFDLAAGETKAIVTRIANFDPSGNATKISLNNELKCKSYLFSDPIVRLINIPIQ